MEEIIAQPSVTKKLLKKYNLDLNKSIGQNMLIDQNILNIIIDAANVNTKDLVVEIGPGLGALTQQLLFQLDEGKLIAVEKDTRMIKILQDIFSDKENFQLVAEDVLEINWHKLLASEKDFYDEIKVVANLPYYITSPVIMELLTNDFFFSRLTFMVQKEVAERMEAEPGTKAFGSLSVAVQYRGKVEIVHNVSSEVFIPKPGVESCIVTIVPYRENFYNPINEDFFFRVVKSIFQQRRKTIKNSLLKGSVLDLEKDLILAALDDCGLDPIIRGEKLSINEMVAFSNSLWKKHREDVI